ncbi:hypothetical protein BJI48_04095 [Helicobacter sp. 11S02596-1]|nr:hypothetical protein BJI48_04095 [Helicobacter sp. 11S02596-1]
MLQFVFFHRTPNDNPCHYPHRWVIQTHKPYFSDKDTKIQPLAYFFTKYLSFLCFWFVSARVCGGGGANQKAFYALVKKLSLG